MMGKEFHVLNLGAGVQSTVLYLMGMQRELDHPFNAAIFADPGDEPEAVYRHLDWLESLGGPEIIRASRGCLADDLKNGRDGTTSFSSIPAFTSVVRGENLGIIQRQCTRDYKARVVEQTIRRKLVGLKPRQRMPDGVRVCQYFGFSFDEPGRAARTRGRFHAVPWGRCEFPLIDEKMTRGDCLRWLDEFGVPHETPRSACVFCPFHSNAEWRRVKRSPKDWERACEVDEMLREPGSVVNQDLGHELFVHRSCRPLREANLDEDQKTMFDIECEGGCGL